jgi:hypothetical protein
MPPKNPFTQALQNQMSKSNSNNKHVQKLENLLKEKTRQITLMKKDLEKLEKENMSKTKKNAEFAKAN